MSVIQGKIFMLFIMIFVGFISEKIGYVNGIKASVSKVITRITLPLLVITTLSSQKADGQMAIGAGLCALLAFIIIIFLFGMGLLCSIPFKFSRKRKDAFLCLSAFGNVMFLGYPLIGAVFGDIGIFYAAFYALVNDLMLWTLGLLMISREKGKNSFKKLLNPSTVAFLIGLIMFGLRIKLPGVLSDAATSIGSATVPLSMLFIGAALAEINPKRILNNLTCLTTVVIKMLIAPLIAFVLTNFIIRFFNLQVDSMVATVIALQVAMPCQTIFAVIAEEYNSDTEYAASCIFVTTLASLFTIPIVYNIITNI